MEFETHRTRTPSDGIRIGIVIATMKRPRMIEGLLRSIAQLRFKTMSPAVEIIIVDNDPEASAQSVVDRMRLIIPFTLHYVVEKRKGIPFTRNRGIQEIHKHCDFIVFVDDDETVDPDWLEELLKAQQCHSADVVAGPVESILPKDAPSWATRGKIYQHLAYDEGTHRDWCATGNVLMRSSIFSQIHPWFDERLCLTGGSDRHFFHRVHAAGFTIVWTNKAVAREEIPKSRVKIRWVLRRMYRQGTCNGFCEMDLERKSLPRLRILATAAASMGVGVLLLPFGLLLGSHRLVQYLRYMAYSLGLLASLGGTLVDEYDTIHGD